MRGIGIVTAGAPMTALEAFAAELSAETDPARRQSLLKRAELLAMNDAPEESFSPLRVESLAEVAAGGLEPPPVLVPGVIVEGQVNWLAGHPGHGKTTIAMY